MKPLLCAFCLTTLLLGAARASEQAPAADPTPATIKLAHLSSFTASNTRNPFWPIGWTKPNPTNPNATEVAPLITPASFALTSVATGGGERFAILNGKVMQEGAQFSIALGSQSYPMTVQAIEDGQVILAYSGGQVVVPLRRH